MIEESIVGNVVDSIPYQRFIVFVASDNWGQGCAVSPNLRMATHADIG
jgi:hypothetical protein